MVIMILSLPSLSVCVCVCVSPPDIIDSNELFEDRTSVLCVFYPVPYTWLVMMFVELTPTEKMIQFHISIFSLLLSFLS